MSKAAEQLVLAGLLLQLSEPSADGQQQLEMLSTTPTPVQSGPVSFPSETHPLPLTHNGRLKKNDICKGVLVSAAT